MNVNSVEYWNSLTAEQIIELKQEGKNVPDAYYQGALEQMGEVSQTSADTTIYKIIVNNDTDAGEELYKTLEEEGNSKRDIAKNMAEECDAQRPLMMQIIESIASELKQSKSIGQNITNQIISANENINIFAQRKNTLEQKAENEGLTNSELEEYYNCCSDIASVTSNAQDITGSLTSDLEVIASTLETTVNQSTKALEISEKTIEVGNNLLGKGNKRNRRATALGTVYGLGIGGVFGKLFGGRKNKKAGKKAIKAGSALQTIAGKANVKIGVAAVTNKIDIVSSKLTITNFKSNAQQKSSANVDTNSVKEPEDKTNETDEKEID